MVADFAILHCPFIFDLHPFGACQIRGRDNAWQIGQNFKGDITAFEAYFGVTALTLTGTDRKNLTPQLPN